MLGPETSGPGPTRALTRIHAGAPAQLGRPYIVEGRRAVAPSASVTVSHTPFSNASNNIQAHAEFRAQGIRER
ncbi:hypothetical protein NDU88_001168 [Pleurodeles waltl]|uniref:Uncharacterized protein n=1 Tax=Pleurodeles waltl TaxID=8319 RepID=A0AAV7NED7_PLEWA|nr:hypothetical protein NDU88_001168 [Pleurodeles waltl]